MANQDMSLHLFVVFWSPPMKSRILMAAALVAGIFVFAGNAQAFTLGGCGCEVAVEPSCCEPVSCCKPKRCWKDRLAHHLKRCCKPSCCEAAPSCCEAAPSCCEVAEPTCEAAPSCGCEAAPTCCKPKRCWKPKFHFHLKRCCKPACCDVAPSCGCEVAAPSCGCGA
jgi:hypothetical protein